MSSTHHHFRLGAFDCVVVLDGFHTYLEPVQKWFVNAPPERLKDVLHNHGIDLHSWREYVSPYPSLVVDTGEHVVLIDTGAGSMDRTTGRLLPNLQAAGIALRDIDLVILTHAHPDHIGGILDGQGRLAFPNARFVMWQQEWAFWTSEPDLEHVPIDEDTKQLIITCARRNLPLIQNRLDLVDRETEIVPGIRSITAPGHTPGHMALSISSNNESLLCMADAFILPIHFEQPDWYSVNDFSTDQTIATRHRLLDMATANNMLLHGFHFPFPGLGRVLRQGNGWKWQPVRS